MLRYRLLTLVAALTCAIAEAQLRHPAIQYGVPTTITWWFFNDDGRVDTDEADDGSGDSECTLSKDHATPGAIAAQYTYDTDSDEYRIAFTAVEAEFGVASMICPQAGETNVVVEITTHSDVKAFDKTRAIASGVLQSATSTTAVLENGTNIGDDLMNLSTLYITGGTGVGQRNQIANWISLSDTAEFAVAWTTTPDSTSQYVVIPNYQQFLLVDSSGRPIVDVDCLDTDCTAGANIKSFFNGGAYESAGTIAYNADWNAEIQSEVEDALDKGLVVARGTCDAGSNTTRCEDDAVLTQADGFWSNRVAIVVSGHGPRCVRGFESTDNRLTWLTPDALPVEADGLAFVLVSAPSCRTFP
jgi:hypothetical protein